MMMMVLGRLGVFGLVVVGVLDQDQNHLLDLSCFFALVSVSLIMVSR